MDTAAIDRIIDQRRVWIRPVQAGHGSTLVVQHRTLLVNHRRRFGAKVAVVDELVILEVIFPA